MEYKMKSIFSMLIIISLTLPQFAVAQALSSTATQDFDAQMSDVDGKTKIKEVKEYLTTVDANSTCLDELLNARKVYGKRLWLTPLISLGAIPLGTYILMAAGAASAGVLYPGDPWAGLGMVIAGLVFGGGSLVVSFVATETVYLTKFLSAQVVSKMIYESYTGANKTLNKAYKAVLRKNPNLAQTTTIKDFAAFIREEDTSAKLCDGSYRKQTKKDFKKVARKKDIIKAFIRAY